MVSNEEIRKLLDAKRSGADVEKSKVQIEESKICPHCKTKNPEKTIFCLKCGRKFDNIHQNKCPSCNHLNPTDAKFCIKCGQSLISNEEEKKEVSSEEKAETKVETPVNKSEKKDEPLDEAGNNETPKVIPTSVPEHAIISKTGKKKTCPACGAKNLQNSKFCVVCGKKFDEKKVEADNASVKIETSEKVTETAVEKEESDIDPVEKIKKAKELLDIGAISSEEFEEIKNKYLKQI